MKNVKILGACVSQAIIDVLFVPHATAAITAQASDNLALEACPSLPFDPCLTEPAPQDST